MKLTDFLQDVGRPIAYYPKLRSITGSTSATILLCQFIYWRGKESDSDGWLYKTSSDIEEETGLSYEEQKTARRNLVDNGLLEEHYARLDHQMKFRLLLDNIDERWAARKQPVPEQVNATFGKAEIHCSYNVTENTTESTHTKSASLPLTDQNADWIYEQYLLVFCEPVLAGETSDLSDLAEIHDRASVEEAMKLTKSANDRKRISRKVAYMRGILQDWAVSGKPVATGKRNNRNNDATSLRYKAVKLLAGTDYTDDDIEETIKFLAEAS